MLLLGRIETLADCKPASKRNKIRANKVWNRHRLSRPQGFEAKMSGTLGMLGEGCPNEGRRSEFDVLSL